MKVIPVGERILVKPDKIEETTKSGLYLPTKKEQEAQVVGEVLEVGADAYREYSSPWCKKGDKVLYQRYAGMRIPDGNGGFLEGMLLLNDLDVTGRVIEDEETNNV